MCIKSPTPSKLTTPKRDPIEFASLQKKGGIELFFLALNQPPTVVRNRAQLCDVTAGHLDLLSPPAKDGATLVFVDTNVRVVEEHVVDCEWKRTKNGTYRVRPRNC